MKRTSWYSIYKVFGVSRMGVPQERSAAVSRSWKDKFLRSLRRRGLVGTVKYGAALIAYRIRGRFPSSWAGYLEWWFDRRFAVDTRGEVYLPELRTDPKYEHALHYGTCACFFVRRALKFLPVDHRDFTFVDFGCGKGKALLIASDWPFREIIGVELSPALVGVAERNIATYRGKKKGCRSFRLVCADARDYEIPPGSAVLYFFDPFREPVLRAVIERVGRSVAQCPREVFIIYKHAVHRTMMDALPFLSLVRESPWYVIYRVVPSVAGPSEAGGQARTGSG
jgi:SAM-dependent methyltransferase